MHYTELVKGHKKYIEIEPRDEIYKNTVIRRDFWNNLTNCNVDSINTILLPFLRQWNRRIKYNANDIQITLQKIGLSLTDLYGVQIENINLNDKKTREIIKEAFYTLSKSVKYTGASKVLHLAKPDLFVMWDDAIRKAWGCFNNSEAFLNFTIRMQEEAKEAINIFCSEFNVKPQEAKLQICQMCDKDKTLPKLIDQYNYVKFTKRTLWEREA